MLKNPDYLAARALLLQTVQPVGTERVPLWQAHGRVLAEEIRAAEDVPPFDRSPYDGYAFRSTDSANASAAHPVTLRVIGEVPAGAVPTRVCTAGTAVKVLTGAPIPEGADAVVMFEKTEFTAVQVTLFAPAKPGENIIYAGEDVKRGSVLAPAGSKIDPGALGTLAAQGIDAPLVFRVPKVGILSTGDELAEPGAPLPPGCVYNSNRFTLAAALRQTGCDPVYLGLAGDDADAIRALLEQGLASCDAVLATGGVSVGDYDRTPEAMERAGVSLLVRGVSIKPGMACAYGAAGGKLVCALSGNPASSLTNFHAVVQPALRKLGGISDPLPREITVRLRQGFSKKSGITRLLRGRLELDGGEAWLALSADQGNVVLSSAIGCDAMAVIPAGSGPVPAGMELKGTML